MRYISTGGFALGAVEVLGWAAVAVATGCAAAVCFSSGSGVVVAPSARRRVARWWRQWQSLCLPSLAL
ncbi:hypothetical protein [Pyrobaculum aerophilum]|uniref:hypothetical protein n=1 Tax=Pyrobaculum aerophilum TaxID=13773 RepID=UPI00216288B2|nr:hypothetical protein [Pyrobaculum aerophilum]